MQDKHKCCFCSTLPFTLKIIQWHSSPTGPGNPTSRRAAALVRAGMGGGGEYIFFLKYFD